jgi:hypothetical protein
MVEVKSKFGISWTWAHAIRCAICTLPAVPVILVSDPSKGLAWAIGILPAAIVGLGPTRRSRLRLVVVGLLFGLSILMGSILTQTSLTAVVGIFAIAYGSALLASRKAYGMEVMLLCAPASAIGLSYTDLSKAALLGLFMFAGSVFSYVVFLLWPEYPDRAEPAPRLLPLQLARRYGVGLGLAGASATAISIAIHTDHVGWAPAAALFVMRPIREMQLRRSVGRVLSVLLGSLVAVVFVRASPSTAALSLFAVAAIAGAGGTRGSRWYVTPIFGTSLILTMLLYSNATVANEQWRFKERVGETVLGVGLAYFFGLVVPSIWAHLRPPPPETKVVA